MLYSKIFLIALVIIAVSHASELSDEEKLESEIEAYEKELRALEPNCNDHGSENQVHSRSKRSIFKLKLLKLALLKKLLLKKKLLIGGGLLLGKKALVLPALLPALTKGAPAAPALPEFPSFKMMPELPSLTSLPLVPELLSKVQSVKQLLLMPKPPMMMMIHHPPPPPPPPVFLPEPMIDTGYHYAPPQMPFAKYGPP